MNSRVRCVIRGGKEGMRKKGNPVFALFGCITDVFMAVASIFIPASGSTLDCTARLVQWRIDNLASFSRRKYQCFSLGFWKWWISIEKKKALQVRLSAEHSGLTVPPPIASFTIQLLTLGVTRQRFRSSEIINKEFKQGEDFVWDVGLSLHGKVIIDIEFLDIKFANVDGGEPPQSIWSAEAPMQHYQQTSALTSLDHMFRDGLHADVTINTSNGSIGAHRAILAAGSPVFASMFTHNFKEKQTSMVNIEDISFDECRALLSYMYGCLSSKDFQMYRLSLLQAADKYELTDLKGACEVSLMSDLNCKNVLDRIHCASLCHLPKLKRECFRYLVEFGKVYDLGEDLSVFIEDGDKDHIMELFQEILNIWSHY